MTFSFSSEQLENLRRWRSALETTEAREWFEEEQEGEQRIQSLLARTNFEAGGELKPDDFDELFRLMKRFSRNRALSNLIYNQIGVKEFNDLLRNLYYGKDAFPRRVDEMFKQRGIGIQTLSQFLMALDSSKYPLVTSQRLLSSFNELLFPRVEYDGVHSVLSA